MHGLQTYDELTCNLLARSVHDSLNPICDRAALFNQLTYHLQLAVYPAIQTLYGMFACPQSSMPVSESAAHPLEYDPVTNEHTAKMTMARTAALEYYQNGRWGVDTPIRLPHISLGTVIPLWLDCSVSCQHYTARLQL